MKFQSKSYLVLILFTSFFLSPRNTHAQITPDNTLGSEGSKINSIDALRDRIEGGASRGENLFHSFQEFNIGEGNRVDFANPEGIANIFSRVTGGNISEIFGELGVEGSANLFFLNPNGIIFGENARLNVNGSFLATTADYIEFDNGRQFNAVEPDNPLLSIEIPIGLGFSNANQFNNIGQINVIGSGHALDARGASSVVRTETPNSLSVSPSENLVFIAEEINFDGGIAISPSGNIEIGSVKSGYVKFNSNINQQEIWSFGYEGVETFGNINLINRSLLDVSSVPGDLQLGGGKITVQGRNILSQDGSVILNQNFGDQDAVSIIINASESFQISGTDPIAQILGGIRTEAISRGDGSNIEVSTPLFTIFNGGSVQSFTYSIFPETVSGNISLDVSDLQILNASPRSAISTSNISTFTFGSSQSGNISVNSNTVVIEDGGALASSGFFGAVGEISINATESIRISGFQPTTFVPSSIVSVNSSSPNPGTIRIITPKISIQNGGNISTSTFSDGAAGNIIIDTDNLKIEGRISQSLIPEAQTPSNISSSTTQFNSAFIELLPENLDPRTFIGSPLEGNSGNVEISAASISLRNEGQITVLNSGTGDAGELTINGGAIMLNESEISASTASGEGGNISLNTDNLELLNQSQITASAGGLGNGGNIRINSDTILGIENSDITANAIGGNGGNITINTSGLFFFPDSIIEASSELGIDGTIEINTVADSLQQDLEPFDLNLSTTQELFANSCFVKRHEQQGSFTIFTSAVLHRGGIDFFDSEPLTGLDESVVSWDNTELPDIPPQPLESMIPGDKIITTDDGRILLVASRQSQLAKTQVCN